MYLALLLKVMSGHIVYDPHQLASKRRGCAPQPVSKESLESGCYHGIYLVILRLFLSGEARLSVPQV